MWAFTTEHLTLISSFLLLHLNNVFFTAERIDVEHQWLPQVLPIMCPFFSQKYRLIRQISSKTHCFLKTRSSLPILTISPYIISHGCNFQRWLTHNIIVNSTVLNFPQSHSTWNLQRSNDDNNQILFFQDFSPNVIYPWTLNEPNQSPSWRHFWSKSVVFCPPKKAGYTPSLSLPLPCAMGDR